MFELILAVGLATLISAFCSVSEAALFSVTWSRIEDLRKKNRTSGHTLYSLRQNIDRPITAVLTLNTLAHTAGASIAGAAAAKVFGEEDLVYFAIVFTAIILIFSEIIPKTLGVVYSRNAAPLLSGPIRLLVVVMAPLIWIFGFLARMIKGKTGDPESTEEDILAMVSLTRKAGMIKPYEEHTIKNILSLDNKSVEDVMTPRMVVFSLSSSLTVEQAWSDKGVWHHSRIPVYESDDREDIVGIVYRREILETLANDLNELPVAELMKPVEFVLETLPLDRLLTRFLESRTHLLVALDEYGGMSGIVTLEDVLEEILGKEIVDETDQVADMRELARQRRQSLVRRDRDSSPEDG